jgi:hypothetical protein
MPREIDTDVMITITAATLCNMERGADAWLRQTSEQQQSWRKKAIRFLNELSEHEWTIVPMEEVS